MDTRTSRNICIRCRKTNSDTTYISHSGADHSRPGGATREYRVGEVNDESAEEVFDRLLKKYPSEADHR